MGILDLFINTDNTEKKFKVGDKVRIKYREQEGYIIDITGNLYMVSMNDGDLVDSYTADQIEILF